MAKRKETKLSVNLMTEEGEIADDSQLNRVTSACIKVLRELQKLRLDSLIEVFKINANPIYPTKPFITVYYHLPVGGESFKADFHIIGGTSSNKRITNEKAEELSPTILSGLIKNLREKTKDEENKLKFAQAQKELSALKKLQ